MRCPKCSHEFAAPAYTEEELRAMTWEETNALVDRCWETGDEATLELVGAERHRRDVEARARWDALTPEERVQERARLRALREQKP